MQEEQHTKYIPYLIQWKHWVGYEVCKYAYNNGWNCIKMQMRVLFHNK